MKLIVKANLEDYLKEYKENEDTYKKAFTELLEGKDWVLSAILLQDAIRLAYNPGNEVELIYDVKTLQAIAQTQLDKVLNAFHANRATTEDVYEILKANIKDVDPTGVTLNPEAIELVKNDIIARPNQYLKDMIGHRPKGKTGIEFVLNEHLPFRDIFKDETGFYQIMNDIEEMHESLKKKTNRISEVLAYIASNNYQPAYHATGNRNDNIKQGDYETYGCILEE